MTVASFFDHFDDVGRQYTSHGMFRLLPWSTGLGASKVTADDVKLLAAKQRRLPIMDLPLASKTKRKRADSDDSAGSNASSKMARTLPEESSGLEEKTNAAASAASGASKGDAINGETLPDDISKIPDPSKHALTGSTAQAPSSSASQYQHPPKSALAPLPETQKAKMSSANEESLISVIDGQLSLEILLKHNELRLIDQELAKCQVALEQLRRCAEIPYPATSSTSGFDASASTGSGPAYSTAGVPPVSPAPWGVTDGPYSRHYAKWLITDSRFDGGVEENLPAPAVPTGKTPTKGRTTRGSFAENSMASSSRSGRASVGQKLSALPSGYPQPKDKQGPLMLRRSTDQQLVKLVCLDCRRENFSSAQGFINHCRIAHNRGFASHDAAAIACGEPIDVDENGAIVGGNDTQPTTATAGLVHPLIRAAHITSTTLPSASRSRLPPAAPKVTPKPSRSFIPSTQTPRLSELLQRRGLDIDLASIVSESKSFVPADNYPSDEEMEEPEEEKPQISTGAGHLSMMRTVLQPARATMSPAPLDRPPSSKGVDKLKAKPKPAYLSNLSSSGPYTSPYAASTPAPRNNRLTHQDTDMLDVGVKDLSPHTIESNQAPSLVSDDGDLEIRSDSIGPASDAGDNEQGDLDVQVEDGAGGESRHSNGDHELASSIKGHPARRNSAFRRDTGRREASGRRVSFVSPVRNMQSNQEGAEGKRKE